jgi:hypothetical protein
VFDEDLAHSTPAGQTSATIARRKYETSGVPVAHLKPCEPVGRDGTELPNCAKVYVPHPDGKWGMVFRAIMVDGKVHLHCLAFGVRHHPEDSHAQTVYDVAHQRVHGQPPRR